MSQTGVYGTASRRHALRKTESCSPGAGVAFTRGWFHGVPDLTCRSRVRP
jgi:hypothetical protein